MQPIRVTADRSDERPVAIVPQRVIPLTTVQSSSTVISTSEAPSVSEVSALVHEVGLATVYTRSRNWDLYGADCWFYALPRMMVSKVMSPTLVLLDAGIPIQIPLTVALITSMGDRVVVFVRWMLSRGGRRCREHVTIGEGRTAVLVLGSW